MNVFTALKGAHFHILLELVCYVIYFACRSDQAVEFDSLYLFFPVFDRIGFRKSLRPQWLCGIASDSRARGQLITVHTFSLCNPTSLKAEDQTVEVDSCYPFLPVFDLIKFSKSQGLRWIFGRDSGARGLGFEPHDRRIVSLSKTL